MMKIVIFFEKEIFPEKLIPDETVFKKTLSSFQKASLTKLVGGKHSGASRSSCLFSAHVSYMEGKTLAQHSGFF